MDQNFLNFMQLDKIRDIKYMFRMRQLLFIAPDFKILFINTAFISNRLYDKH